MTKSKRFIFFLIIIFSFLIIAACSGKTSDEGNQEDNNSPGTNETESDGGNNNNNNNNEEELPETPEMPEEEITLKFMMPIGEELFRQIVKDDVEDEFPNITMELIDGTVDVAGLEESFAKNNIPDIMMAHNGYDVLREVDVAYPLDDLIELNQYDLGQFKDGLIDIARARDPYGEGKLYGIPFEDLIPVLFYNKDVFDIFGMDYPTDGMTWDEVINLAKSVSGEVDGMEYRGLGFQTSWHYSFPLSQLSVHGTNPETGEVLFTEQEEFRQYIDLFDQLRTIPGNEEAVTVAFPEQNVAMVLQHLTNLADYHEMGINFDIARFPVWPDKPNSGPTKFIGQTLAINKHSEHQLAAFKVIEYLTSAEKQTKNVRSGRLSPLKDFSVMSEFLREELPDHTYNLEGALSLAPSEPPLYSEWGPYIQFNPNDFYSDIIVEHFETGDDPVTTLRKMAELYQGMVEEKMARN